MSIYEKGSVNIWEIIVVVVFTSVLFITGMYIWTNYKVQEAEATQHITIPKSVLLEFENYKLRYTDSVLESCTTTAGEMYLIDGLGNNGGQIITFDAEGIIVETGSYKSRGDVAHLRLSKPTTSGDCQILERKTN